MRRAKWSASIVRSCAKCFSLLCLHATRLDFSRLASCQHSVKQCLCFGERESSARDLGTDIIPRPAETFSHRRVRANVGSSPRRAALLSRDKRVSKRGTIAYTNFTPTSEILDTCCTRWKRHARLVSTALYLLHPQLSLATPRKAHASGYTTADKRSACHNKFATPPSP